MVYVRLSDLYLMDLGTKVEMLLLNNAAISENVAAGYPQWHPNGRTIFFDVGSIATLLDLYSIESDGTNLRLITQQGSLANAWPSPFSPDGRKLLYNDCFDQCYTLLVFDLDTAAGSSSTTSPTRTYLSKRTGYGAWSPDGRHIAFGDVWGPGLFVADPGGAQVRRILDNVQVGALSWSSDSRRIGLYPGGRRRGGRGLWEHLRGGPGWHGQAVSNGPFRRLGACPRFHGGRRGDLPEDLGTGQKRTAVNSKTRKGFRDEKSGLVTLPCA